MNLEILHEFPAPDLERAWREFLTRVGLAAHYDSPEFFLDPLRRGNRPLRHEYYLRYLFSDLKTLGKSTHIVVGNAGEPLFPNKLSHSLFPRRRHAPEQLSRLVRQILLHVVSAQEGAVQPIAINRHYSSSPLSQELMRTP
jgi:hypothetical protein